MARHIIATGTTAYCGAKADPRAEHEQDYQAVFNGRTRPGTCAECARWLTESLNAESFEGAPSHNPEGADLWLTPNVGARGPRA